MRRGIVVAGVGNIFLSDDGFGSEVARRLADEPMPEGVEVVDYGIGGMHLAYDIADGCDLLIMVDALPGPGAAGSVTLLEIGPDDVASGPVDAHSMDPGSVLASLRTLGAEFPRTLLVGCCPESTDEGIGLSDVVADAVEPAARRILEIVEEELGARVETSSS